MRRSIGIAAAVVAIVSAAAPGGASAQGQCLYQAEAVSFANLERAERSLLCLTNVHRLRSGASALSRDSRLGAAARAHSADMVARDYFSHVTPEGLGPTERAVAAGFPGGAGENIAAGGSRTALGLFELWRNSAGHDANMLGAGYRSFGGGISPGTGAGARITGTQMFSPIGADSVDAGLDLYASGPKCAKAKLTRIAILSRVVRKKGLGPKAKRKLKRARKQIRRSCRPVL